MSPFSMIGAVHSNTGWDCKIGGPPLGLTEVPLLAAVGSAVSALDLSVRHKGKTYTGCRRHRFGRCCTRTVGSFFSSFKDGAIPAVGDRFGWNSGLTVGRA